MLVSQRTLRSFIITGLLLALPLAVQAAPVEATAARAIAGAFLESLPAPETVLARGATVAGDPEPLAYIFTLEPHGYVAVAADDALPPVVAYSLESECPEAAAADNPLLHLLTADLRSRLAALPTLDARVAEARRQLWSRLADGTFGRDERFTQWPPEGSTPTGGWLLSNWTQNAPYNALCPLDIAHGGSRSVAGCPAVAMAMILNYHATIQATAFDTGDRYYHNYAGNAYWIPDAHVQYGFPDFATLNGYLETLTQHWDDGITLTNTDKAALVFGCGVAARQVYSASGSGTFGVDQAYDAYQRFAFTDSRLVFDTDPNLYPDLASNMQNALPAHLAVVDPGWTMGHNVVVDGYNTDDYYHLNFGWGGSYNGWYLLPEEIPYGLTVVEGVVLDIVPASEAVTERPFANGAFALASGPNPFGPQVTLSFTAPAAGHARLGIYDVAGRLQELILDEELAPGARSVAWAPERLPAGVYWARLQLAGHAETRRLVLAR